MSMSKQHFEAVAKVLRETYTPTDEAVQVRNTIARELARELSRFNGAFQTARFLRASGVEDA